MPLADKTGQRFERLLVIKKNGWYKFPSSVNFVEAEKWAVPFKASFKVLAPAGERSMRSLGFKIKLFPMPIIGD